LSVSALPPIKLCVLNGTSKVCLRDKTAPFGHLVVDVARILGSFIIVTFYYLNFLAIDKDHSKSLCERTPAPTVRRINIRRETLKKNKRSLHYTAAKLETVM
jgi:hypothetical protein